MLLVEIMYEIKAGINKTIRNENISEYERLLTSSNIQKSNSLKVHVDRFVESDNSVVFLKK